MEKKSKTEENMKYETLKPACFILLLVHLNHFENRGSNKMCLTGNFFFCTTEVKSGIII